jgi:hypothetical protein
MDRGDLGRVLAMTAMSGILAACAGNRIDAKDPSTNAVPTAPGEKNCCQGKNECRSQSGCRTPTNASCAGQNSCKHQGTSCAKGM